MNYWLLKSDSDTYPFSQMKKEKITDWTGVRNFQARNNMKAMQKGDLCFFYHSGEDKAIVGIVEVVKEHYPDPEDEKFVLIDVKFKLEFKKMVTLSEIKADAVLKNMALVKQSRLSVMPVSKKEWEIINAKAA